MRRELRVFLTAVMYFSRIPVPKWVDHSEEYLVQSTRYFPLVGWVTGGTSALVFWLFNKYINQPVAAVAAIGTGILITGAFHEDGFADFCDGFGGGWTKEKILAIMKDHHTGAYGALGLVMMMLAKFALLSTTASTIVPFMLFASASLSRFAASTFLYTHTYARPDSEAKAGPHTVSLASLAVGAVFGLLPLIYCKGVFALVLVPVFLARVYLGHYFKKWIGGYTGDCIGAAQQIFEVLSYLGFAVTWKFI